MTYSAIIYKPCHTALRKMSLAGHKKEVQAVRAALAEASLDGEIRAIPRTKYGESRLENIEKYDLGNGFRLVVQLIDGVKRSRVFLFAGTHDDTQRWLDTHKNYKWVQTRTDKTLDFVLVSPREERHVPFDRLNLTTTEDEREKPILDRLTPDDWKKLALSPDSRAVVDAVDADAFELEAESILDRLSELSGYETASLLFDLMWHAHSGDWPGLRQRLRLMHDKAAVIADELAVDAMQAVENSEDFITFDDTGLWDEFFERGTLAEWMLFLHPEQRQVVDRELRGPSRLRGVSGSGKTCVLVHRARALARKYQQAVLLVTLTESMRKLLERLLDDLCGVERSLIHVKTMSMLAKDVLVESGDRSFTGRVQSEHLDQAYRYAEIKARGHQEFARSVFREMPTPKLIEFLRSEISYVRGRLTEARLDEYLEPRLFQRRGRGTALSSADRRIVLHALKAYTGRLIESQLHDHETIVSKAIGTIEAPTYIIGRYRCVLSDEVQDLCELDLQLMGLMKTPDGFPIGKVSDGLFLAGDGAQSIYKRGFVLRRVGIDIVGRSYNLKKNYRNTHEILKAAFGLVSQFEFADVDEEILAKPSMPDYAESHGGRPLLLRCTSADEEVSYVASQVASSLAMGQQPGQVCVIAPSQSLRVAVEAALASRGVSTAGLRDDVDYESDNVKVSTIESAKGHEFSAVYIMGLVEGALPSTQNADELPREASRLYVAMTRAREKLVITYSPTPKQPASRFLNAIQGDCDEAHIRGGEFRKIIA